MMQVQAVDAEMRRELELMELERLMAEPPWGSFQSIRAPSIGLALGDDPSVRRRRVRVLQECPRCASRFYPTAPHQTYCEPACRQAARRERLRSGRPAGRPAVAAPEIERLAALGWAIAEIVIEGARRRDAGEGGWSQRQAYRALAHQEPLDGGGCRRYPCSEKSAARV